MNPEYRERFYRRERQSVPAARDFTQAALVAWRKTTRADEILLCVSELTTNALLHGVPPGRGFLLRITHDEVEDTVRVEVHDSGTGTPAVPVPQRSATAENGRGLLLVEALADKWGVGERDPGKEVWCEFGPGTAQAPPEDPDGARTEDGGYDSSSTSATVAAPPVNTRR
ncbi:ATP-binding protein [Streptomyces sp. NPDC001904]|uniref:ATP-binding protein n=1 Tax=Streptomyces sp. NPDC001904 TaxID=3154531 RepID=UPI0033232EBD